MNSEKLLYYMSMQFQKWNNKGVDIELHQAKNILIIKWDEIGDMTASLHVFELLKGSHPNATITVHCKAFVNELLHENPFVDHIVNHLKDISITEFDTIIELRGSTKSFKKISLNRPKVYLGRGIVRYKNRGNQKHETVTNYEIIQPLLKKTHVPVSPKVYTNDAAKTEVSRFIEHLNKDFFILHVLARKELRQWPIDRFAAIAQYIQNKYKLTAVLVGAQSEEEQLKSIIKSFPKGTEVFCSKNALLGFAALCEKAKLFIGNESGPMQIAATVETLPLIALYGPGVPEVFYPVGHNKKVLHHILDCNPCDQVKCVQPENPCINLIELLDVQASIDELISPQDALIKGN
jgi:ADP-heptose:LPS heptosyltransferase